MRNFKFTTEVLFNGQNLQIVAEPIIYKTETSVEQGLNDREVILKPGYYAGIVLNKKLSKEERLSLGIIKAKDNRNTMITHLVPATISQNMDELVENTYAWIRSTEVDLISASISKPQPATAG